MPNCPLQTRLFAPAAIPWADLAFPSVRHVLEHHLAHPPVPVPVTGTVSPHRQATASQAVGAEGSGRVGTIPVPIDTRSISEQLKLD
jgi:hypothetical protein